MIVERIGDVCPYCGTKLDKNSIVCSECLKENQAGNKFCSYCGASLYSSDSEQDMEGEESKIYSWSSSGESYDGVYGEMFSKKAGEKEEIDRFPARAARSLRVWWWGASKTDKFVLLILAVIYMFVILVGMLGSVLGIGSDVSDEENEIESQVLYEEDGIEVTAVSIEPYYGENSNWISRLIDKLSYNSQEGYCLELKLENTGDRTLSITVVDGSVNGYMCNFTEDGEGDVVAYVSAGRTETCTLYFLEDDLEDAGIKTILEVEFRMEIENADGDVDISDFMTVTTQSYGEETQEYDDSGTVAYDEDGLKIVYQGIDQDTEYFYLKFYMENESGQDIHLIANAADTVVLNDTYTLYTSEIDIDLMDGKKVIHTLRLSKDDLEEYYGLDSTNDFERYAFSYEIVDADTLETIGDTGKITVDLD